MAAGMTILFLVSNHLMKRTINLFTRSLCWIIRRMETNYTACILMLKDLRYLKIMWIDGRSIIQILRIHGRWEWQSFQITQMLSLGRFITWTSPWERPKRTAPQLLKEHWRDQLWNRTQMPNQIYCQWIGGNLELSQE